MKVIWAEERINLINFHSFLKIKFKDGSSKVFRHLVLASDNVYTCVDTGVQYGDSVLYEPIPDFIREALFLVHQKKQDVNLIELQEAANQIQWSQ